MSGPPGRAAFFDVDETLVNAKTMFRFLEYHLTAQGWPPEVYRQARAELQRMADQGLPREEVNRAYYRQYAGASARGLTEQGERWFRREARDPGFFHRPGVEALRAHLAAGDRVVLVSGSFFPCLDPIARHLGAHAALGTTPLLEDGLLTGEVARPMIGTAKGEAAAAWAREQGVDLAACSAYGDHASDLDLLRTVGRPVAVGADPVLLAYVAAAGGDRLTGAVTG